ncbi:MAG: TonB C-terminal domain-containing protein [candidate division WOR-3 bacterium]|nr:TonB C-terminal domain-containing protein [candidate division WOR-3 bacterium]
MKKELSFSFIGHLLLFTMLAMLTRPGPKQKSYPEVFQVSVVNFASDQALAKTPSPIAVIQSKPKLTAPSKTKSISERSVRKTGDGIGLKLSSQPGRHSYYIEAVLSKIASNWVNPFAGSQIRLSTTICFVILKNGELRNIKIEKSSGNEIYDRAAERAVIITKTVPQLSGEFANQESLKIHLEFEYKP